MLPLPSTTGSTAPHAELKAVSDRLLGSAALRRSPRLREFLSFVVRCALDGRAHEINEYSLGVQVFGKAADYNPNLDNIVRVTARQLRAKIAEFYASEGAEDPWRLEIPKGSYLPVVQARPVAEAARTAVPAKRPGWMPAALAGLSVLALGGWACVAWLYTRQSPEKVSDGYALRAILTDRSLPTLVVMDDPILSMAWNQLGVQQSLDQFLAGRYLNDKRYDTPQGALVQNMLQGNYTVRESTMRLAQELGRIAAANGVKLEARHCRRLAVEDLEHGNFVFIGGIGANPWVEAIQKRLSFSHVVDPAQRRRYFEAKVSEGGRMERFESDDKKGASRKLYTRVAILRNPFGPGRVSLLGGTSRDATEAAGLYALSERSVAQVRQLCGAQPEELSSYELILETSAIGQTPVAASVVAHRCGQRQ